jgi:hypothetical protein
MRLSLETNVHCRRNKNKTNNESGQNRAIPTTVRAIIAIRAGTCSGGVQIQLFDPPTCQIALAKHKVQPTCLAAWVVIVVPICARPVSSFFSHFDDFVYFIF